MLDLNQIRQDFPMLNAKQMQGHPLVYFDNGATTFKPYAVIDAILHYYQDITCNAHRGDYDLSYQVDSAFEATRERVAKFINADKKEVIFTSGATDSLNQIAYGYGKKLNAEDIILTSEAEHASCILPWMRVCEEQNALMQYIPLDEDGRLHLEHFEECMSEKVKVVVLAHVSNVLGYVLPMKEICEIAHRYNAIVVVDASQSIPHMRVDVQDLDCDFLVFSAHKMCGPTGIGILYGKYVLLDNMDAMFLGGGSNARFDMHGNIMMKKPPFKFESGTPNVEGVLGLKAAIDYLDDLGMQNIHEHERKLHDYMVNKMLEMENMIVYNPYNNSGIISFNIKDVFAQDGATYFNGLGIAVRSGQHCAKLLGGKLNTSATIRASIYFYNTFEEADSFLEACRGATMETCLDVYF